MSGETLAGGTCDACSLMRATVQRYREKNGQLSAALKFGAQEARAAIAELTLEKHRLGARILAHVVRDRKNVLLRAVCRDWYVNQQSRSQHMASDVLSRLTCSRAPVSSAA